VDTRLPAPATAEGITAARKPDPHDIILAHPGLGLLQCARSGMTGRSRAVREQMHVAGNGL
jgi:hypothetical protein